MNIMPLDNTLSAEEQRFFETGELTPGMQQTNAPAPSPDAVDPLALAGLGNAEPVAAPSPAASPVASPAPAPTPDQHTVADAQEILRQSLAQAQQRVGHLEQFIRDQQALQQTQNQPQAPDKDTDPLGAMMHQLDTVNAQVAQLQALLNQQQVNQSNVAQFSAFQQQVRAIRDEYAKTTPDFTDAYSHWRDGRAADLRAMGLPEQQIKHNLFVEEVSHAEASIRNGRNPAADVYEMAKRHGYTPKAVGAPAVQTPDAKLQAIQQAQSAARSLPKVPDTTDITLEGLKNMSDADMNKIVLDTDTWNKIVGKDQYPL
jgi:hypothetical protein